MAGVVANEGIAVNTGANTSDIKNKTAVTTDARPVLAPAATPALDSTKLVTVEVPRQEPTIVPTASAVRAPPALGSLPSLSRRLPFSATPMSVPTVSKISV